MKRGKRELIFLIFAKKNCPRTSEDWECPLSSVLQKQQKRNISENIFAPQSFNTRSSQSVITIKRRVVSRGARD